MSEWRIYQGVGKPHDGIDHLPAPPPWRDFGNDEIFLNGIEIAQRNIGARSFATQQHADEYRANRAHGRTEGWKASCREVSQKPARGATISRHDRATARTGPGRLGDRPRAGQQHHRFRRSRRRPADSRSAGACPTAPCRGTRCSRTSPRSCAPWTCRSTPISRRRSPTSPREWPRTSACASTPVSLACQSRTCGAIIRSTISISPSSACGRRARLSTRARPTCFSRRAPRRSS